MPAYSIAMNYVDHHGLAATLGGELIKAESPDEAIRMAKQEYWVGELTASCKPDFTIVQVDGKLPILTAGEKDKLIAALGEFCTTVENTGGIYRSGLHPRPMGDLYWTDLGCAYLSACKALGREPKITKEDPDVQ